MSMWVSGILLWGCIGFISSTQKPATVCQTDACKLSAQYLLSVIDETQDPCKDFYQFACGGFINKNKLPADATEYGNREILSNKALELIQEILEAKNPSSTLKKAQSLYKNCMKEENDVSLLKNEIEKLGGLPLVTPKQRTNTISLDKLLANLTLRGTKAIISSVVKENFENSNEYIIQANYGDLPLDKNLIRTKSFMNAYIQFVTFSAETLGAPNSHENKIQINEMKTFLEQLTNLIPVQDVIINITEVYQIMTIGELQQYTDPSEKVFNWLTYYNTLFRLKLTISEPVAVYNLNYLVKTLQLLESTNKNTVINYVMWCFINDYAWHAGGPLQQGYVKMTEALTGVTAAEPRNTSCTKFANKVFGYALTKPYVTRVFPSPNFEHVQHIIKLAQSTFEMKMGDTNIYDPLSRAIAQEKVLNMKFRIGYPKWIENDHAIEKYYSTFSVTGAHFTNAINSMTSMVEKELKLLHVPVDKSRFNLAPATVQGDYDYSNNAITLPAAILQQPYYTAGQQLALDLGSLGSFVISLMMSGLNNIGSQFDQYGNLNNTWTSYTQNAVAKDNRCIADQYNGYCSATNPTLCINGKETVLEHVAELIGAMGAYDTYEAWLLTNPQEPKLPGLEKYTSKQLLFINFAQRYCTANVPANIVNKIGYDPQLENRYTVIGALANIKGFADTFKCPLGLMNTGEPSCI